MNINLSPSAIRLINSILSDGNEVRIFLVGKRLRIVRVRSNTEYDIMI